MTQTNMKKMKKEIRKQKHEERMAEARRRNQGRKYREREMQTWQLVETYADMRRAACRAAVKRIWKDMEEEDITGLTDKHVERTYRRIVEKRIAQTAHRTAKRLTHDDLSNQRNIRIYRNICVNQLCAA